MERGVIRVALKNVCSRKEIKSDKPIGGITIFVFILRKNNLSFMQN